MNHYPFIFGAQYYRAPTPEPECWQQDLKRMRELGLNAVKLWVQWRWSHRRGDRFIFDDIDRLMDLSADNGLAVTLNTIFDVSPLWLYGKHPDAKQIDASGRIIEPYTVAHRQIGGHPGPCYNHPGALEERKLFMAATVDHFSGHPALSMWDVWNEPEQSFQARHPDMKTLVCYCEHCRRGFLRWLEAKYGAIERLNEVWGRCYGSWEQLELPRGGGAINDFVDWREFHLDTMTSEAAWRLEMVRERDPEHPCYLHVVPNVISVFNSVTCVDDFAMAERCDVFAATMNGGPVLPSQVVSAGRGKVCYNVESHLNYGSLGTHQRILALPDLLADFVPQIGMGVKGFLFWQYRPEVLGVESPAWGLVQPDGSDRPITQAARTFWSRLAPHAERLMEATPASPEIAIWKSRKNEIFHFAVHRSLESLTASVEGYIHCLYRHNYAFRIISGRMLAAGELDGVKLLIMPSCYCVTEEEAAALDRWVRGGGTLLCEAHLAGYNATSGRHSRTVPGCGLAASWALRETNSTSSYHLRLEQAQAFEGSVPEDVRKALDAFGTSGGRLFPIRLADGSFAWGVDRYAVLGGEGITVEGSFDGVEPCIASRTVGDGLVLYSGTNLGEGARQGDEGLVALLRKCFAHATISPTLAAVASPPGSVHVDALCGQSGPRFLAVQNLDDEARVLTVEAQGTWRGLFSGEEWELRERSEIEVAGRFVELFVKAGDGRVK